MLSERYRVLDLNLIVVFDALLKHRNVSRAAEELCRSQSAISHALARLRKHFGDDLFVKVQDGIVPTTRALELEPAGTCQGQVARTEGAPLRHRSFAIQPCGARPKEPSTSGYRLERECRTVSPQFLRSVHTHLRSACFGRHVKDMPGNDCRLNNSSIFERASGVKRMNVRRVSVASGYRSIRSCSSSTIILPRYRSVGVREHRGNEIIHRDKLRRDIREPDEGDCLNEAERW
ncbi:regulatory helix-turn-helix protein, lysR family [Novosphingobium mathurense]|uniref:Regulatory helix-turn-helix protein, lysR family n=1 Tax=Novosphingobium mathurense TaxID=428990 RepID=A0A1U6IQM5_9SPHN|nr:regulatory helix-turn-helix protein, lysR family [Novosphingobium mathurense]